LLGVLGYTIDITYLKKVEQELIEANKKGEVLNSMKTEFMRNVEHDVRTPFSGLCGLSSIVWEQEQDPQNKEFLGYVVDSAQEMLNYCNEIVDFSQIESGMKTLQEKKFALQTLVEGVIKMLRPSAITKHLALTLDYDTKITTPVLRGDPRRVQRILMNLLGNAIKFTKEGQVTLKVVALPAKEARTVLIRFMIEDSGIGIPQDKQDVIFEKFTRLTLSNTGAYKGIGLGLSIVKQFTHEMGGEIDVISELHQGTTFVCTLPFRCPLSDDFVEEETRRGQ
jgi:signal transduction histidine kinase